MDQMISEQVEGVLTESETLAGDLRDAILDRIKNQDKPWQAMGFDEQAALIDGVEQMAGNLVRNVVRMVALQGRVALTGTLDQVVVKDGLKGVIKMSSEDAGRFDLIDAVGRLVLVVVADPSGFMGQKAEAVPDAPRDGQDDLPFGDPEDKPVFDRTAAGQAG